MCARAHALIRAGARARFMRARMRCCVGVRVHVLHVDVLVRVGLGGMCLRGDSSFLS